MLEHIIQELANLHDHGETDEDRLKSFIDNHHSNPLDKAAKRVNASTMYLEVMKAR